MKNSKYTPILGHIGFSGHVRVFVVRVTVRSGSIGAGPELFGPIESDRTVTRPTNTQTWPEKSFYDAKFWVDSEYMVRFVRAGYLQSRNTSRNGYFGSSPSSRQPGPTRPSRPDSRARHKNLTQKTQTRIPTSELGVLLPGQLTWFPKSCDLIPVCGRGGKEGKCNWGVLLHKRDQKKPKFHRLCLQCSHIHTRMFSITWFVLALSFLEFVSAPSLEDSRKL